MLTLHELQKQFVKSLDNGAENIFDAIQSTPTLSAKNHFLIYQNSILGTLEKVLKEVYPVCHKLVGDPFFIAMSHHYIENTPSYSPDLGNYGRTFAHFISQFHPTKSLPYLADVAHLEWAWHRLFYATENKILDLKKLAHCYETDGEHIIFSLPTESCLLSSPYPVHTIWEMNQDDFTDEKKLALENDTHYFFIIWRDQLKMKIDTLSHSEWQVLSWIQKKIPLGKIAENKHINLIDILPKLIQQKWICSFFIQS